ncbi:MAG: YccF domain-containing protein [Ileibacterium sp.]|nr:YccF domain-containing protein [Ileibacterium sp.]
MKTFLNIIWLLFCGLWMAIGWTLSGLLWSITILGLPIGIQCFKFASLALCPFGREVVNNGGAGSFLLNIVWIIVSGLPMALLFAAAGLILSITIIGIPFGLQCFKMAKLALMPFGSEIVPAQYAYRY